MPTKATKFSAYGMKWDSATWTQLAVEFFFIQRGGYFTKSGKTYGMGLFHHHREAESLCWPEDDHHRWSDLGLSTIIENEITVFMGCGDSNKTYRMSRFILIDWWAFPNDTLWLISSTEYRGAELRIWGKIKELFNRARNRFPWLPGHVLESMHAITTEEIDEKGKDARSLQRGLILVPSKVGGQAVGLSAFIGIKAPRLRHAGDEVSVMSNAFLDAYSNWYGKENFKGVMAGNPLDPSDPLCIAAEPLEGWDNFIDTGKTQTWRSKFFNAMVVAYDGRDSPNNDFPANPPKYPYLIGPKKLNAIAETHGAESWQMYNQGIGKPNSRMVLWRVITRQICKQHKALEEAEWFDSKRTLLYALDPAFGGGDRCVGGPLEFGLGMNGKWIIKIHPQEIVPIKLSVAAEPEDQIAAYLKVRLGQLGIPVTNCFYDSFGRGTLGFSFAKEFGFQTPVPVDSGAQPTTRPVRFDLFVEEPDGSKRLKRCDEHYSKFVTEMWFSVREAIEGEQIRELPADAMDEGCARIYSVVKGNRIEIESKKDYKERHNFSPDKFDHLAIGVEGARRLGFKIQRLGVVEDHTAEDDWEKDSADFDRLLQSKMLKHAA